jgi:hypothetical protein
MIPRDEFISNPTLAFIPYLHTSELPPCAPTPGTNKKLSGTTLRISVKYSALVALRHTSDSLNSSSFRCFQYACIILFRLQTTFESQSAFI